jgi:hypothetical protein
MRLRTDGVTWQEIDGELVILDLQRSVYLTTNQTGAVLVGLLKDDLTEPQLVDGLQAEFSVETDQAARDVEAFLATLREKQLLVE